MICFFFAVFFKLLPKLKMIFSNSDDCIGKTTPNPITLKPVSMKKNLEVNKKKIFSGQKRVKSVVLVLQFHTFSDHSANTQLVRIKLK